jgi:hypothetical protein
MDREEDGRMGMETGRPMENRDRAADHQWAAGLAAQVN